MIFKDSRAFLWVLTIFYIFFIFSSLFYGKDIAKHIYKILGYHYYSLLISFLFFLGLVIIFLNNKKNYTFFEFIFIALAIFINGLAYFLTKFPTDRIHLLEYMILGLLLYKAINKEKIGNKKFKFFLSFLILFSIAIEDEILQSYLPNRDAELEDIIRDTIGGLAGILIAYINENRLSYSK